MIQPKGVGCIDHWAAKEFDRVLADKNGWIVKRPSRIPGRI